MNLWDWLTAAAIFVFVLFLLVVFIDWMNYMNLQARLRKEREKKVLFGLIPIEVSDSTTPGEALFIAPDVFNHEGEIDPNKVVYLKNLEESQTLATKVIE